MNSRRENHVEIIANRLVEQKIDLKPISWGIAEADVLKPPEQIIPFSLAADSPEKGKNYFPTDSPVLSLASEDGSYLVRIFPKASGQGAVAVLIRGEVGSDSSQTERREVNEPEFILVIEDQEFHFDEERIVSLPFFPASSIQMVVRPKRTSSE